MTAAPASATFAERVVDRASRMVPGLSRRGFLFRTAVVGSALAVNPFDFLLKPGTAYAQVCGSGASCSGGWSAFCCTINDGANTCPPGSYVAGWWKVDDSAFCRGGARYYVDCNREPDATCACKCADGACDKRRICCNVFRYGQCNQHVAGVTEVVCRVVTCQPAWEWDPSCTTTARTDNATRSHSATCLPGEWPSHVEIKYQDLGLAGSVLGRPTAGEHDADGGRARRYDNGIIAWHPDHGAHEVHGRLADRYLDLDGPGGPLGFPLRDVESLGGGARSRLDGGWIYARDGERAWDVRGRVLGRYRTLDGPAGMLGWPAGAFGTFESGGQYQYFDAGALYAAPGTAAVEILGPFWDHYRQLGGVSGGTVGFPLAPEQAASGGGRRQRFANGLMLRRDGLGPHAVWGAIAERYAELGAEGGALGHPTRDQQAVTGGRGADAAFESGRILWSATTGAHVVTGPILARYLDEGGPTGVFGFPTTDTFDVSTVHGSARGRQRTSFEHGAITYDPTTGETWTTVGRRSTRDPADAQPSSDPPAPRPTRQP